MPTSLTNGIIQTESAEIYGTAKVKLWRRSYNAAPPKIDVNNKYREQILEDKKYRNLPIKIPETESLEQVRVADQD